MTVSMLKHTDCEVMPVNPLRVYCQGPFDFDHAGEPAIRVVFSVSQKQGLGKVRISKLGYFRRAVRDAILEEDSGSFPYVTFEDAR